MGGWVGGGATLVFSSAHKVGKSHGRRQFRQQRPPFGVWMVYEHGSGHCGWCPGSIVVLYLSLQPSME